MNMIALSIPISRKKVLFNILTRMQIIARSILRSRITKCPKNSKVQARLTLIKAAPPKNLTIQIKEN